MQSDTIVAQASPPGAALRAVLRISGPAARAIARGLCDDPRLEPQRGAHEWLLLDGAGRVPCLCLWFEGPRSYTGEDTLEIHMPGSVPLVEAMLSRVLELGARLAEPGEFTRRAFLNGRIDLTRAEGVLALIESRTQEEQRTALEWLGGGLEREVHAVGGLLLDLRALCEAALDFDENDTAAVRVAELEPLYAQLRARIGRARAAEDARSVRGERARVVLAGAPSAGKSSLFNALLGTPRALVDEAPGTTRDALREEWDLAGMPVLLCDLAGLSSAPRDELDARSQGRARELVAQADLVLWIARADAPALGERPAGSLLVWSQTDRPGAQRPPPGALAVSVASFAGLEALRMAIAHELKHQGSGVLSQLRARHADAWARAAAHLERSWELLEARAPLELCAEELRLSQAALESISGESGVEDLLDRIFARFCLGK